jgi:hypothetical protein
MEALMAHRIGAECSRHLEGKVGNLVIYGGLLGRAK